MRQRRSCHVWIASPWIARTVSPASNPAACALVPAAGAASTGPGLGYHIVDPKGAALPGSLQTNPRLSHWLRFRSDGIVEVSSGKVEIGQGILTAIAQIVADELDVDLARVRMLPASTARSPNEGVTSGSLSIEQSGSALRFACAEARALHLEAAAQRLGVRVQDLSVRDGTIAGPGNLRTSYWELAEDGLLDRDATVVGLSEETTFWAGSIAFARLTTLESLLRASGAASRADLRDITGATST